MNKMISVIIPVYNVEKYLNKCIESVINQTYNNLEIILVDDGSTDNSPQICDKWAKKDNRIKVIHQENEGVSSARNKGLDNATGNYIGFVDSDDYIEKDMYEYLYNTLINSKSDIACCNYNIVNENDDKRIANHEIENRKYNNEKKYELLFRNHNYTVVLWNKLFHKKVFNNVRFPKGKINEDEYVFHRILYNVTAIIITNEHKYNYLVRKNSITHYYSVDRLNQIYAYEERLNFIKEKKLSEDFYQRTLNQLLYDIIQHLRALDMYYINSDKIDIIKNLTLKFKKYYKEFNLNDIRIENKIKFNLFYFFPRISIKIFNILTKI